MAKATLSISSKNYSSWCLRGYLLCKLADLEFDEEVVSLDDPGARAELLLLSPSFLVPCLTDDGVKVWDTLAIAEYLAEAKPNAGLLPADRAAMCAGDAIGRQQPGFRLRLRHVFTDSERIPDLGPVVRQTRDQERGRQQQQLGARARIIERHQNLVELQAAQLAHQPAAQAPGRVVLAGDGEGGLGHLGRHLGFLLLV